MFTTLINSKQLAAIISSANTLVFDCRYNLKAKEAGQEAYQVSHIPGAVYLHMDSDLSGLIIPGKTGRHPLPERDVITQRFSQWGIDSEKQVIVYDDKKGALAARLWWMLNYAGHTKAAVLDGGWQAWLAAGFETEAKENKSTKSTFIANFKTDWILNADKVEKVGKTKDWTIIDSRAAERYRGENEPIDPIAGHVPTAINMPFAENWNEAGLMKTPEVLRQRFAPLPQANRCVFYCGSGVTACHNILAHTHAGLGIPRLYPGSWSDWITKGKLIE